MQNRPPALRRPDRPAHPAARRPRPAVLLVLAAGLVLLGACSTIRVFTDFGEVLSDAGFDDVSVTIDSRGAGVLVVSASAPGGDTLDEAHDRAAELTWRRFPRRFEGVRITLDGDRRDHSRAELEETYGPRPARLDETDLTDEVTRFGVTALVALGIGGLVVVLIVVVTILLIVRARRRRPPGVAAGPGPLPPGTGQLTPWMPPGAHGLPASAGTPPPPPPPPTDWTPPPPAWTPPPPADVSPPVAGSPSAPEAHAAEDRTATRHLGRRPRGPLPPPTQTPPGWDS